MANHHLRAVERVARELAQSQASLRQAMILARLSGETYADIGRAAGLTPERIRQIVAKEERRGG